MGDVDAQSSEYRHFERPREPAIAELAGRQHGIVASWQLEALGYDRGAVKRRSDAGRLHRVFRGVYAVGHLLITLKGRWTAAVIAYGPDAVLSHRSAAALWDLRPTPGGPIDVTVPGRSRHSRRGIRVHTARQLADLDRVQVDGIPVTSLPRTLLDYGEVAHAQQLRLAIEAAERLDLLDLRAIDELRARSRGRLGLKPLNAVLAQIRGPVPWTRSELERRFLALIREAGLPEPQCNVVVVGELVDFFWPKQRLVVETDGFQFHKTRAAFEDDRRRDVKLQLADLRVVRITQRRIEHESRELLSDLRQLLSALSPARAGTASGR